MNSEHAALLAELRQAARPTHLERHTTDSYGGSGHRFYDLSAPVLRAVAKRWVAAHKAGPARDFLNVLESLFDGESHEEKTLAALMLGCHAEGRRAVRPDDVDRWLGRLNGWAEVDCLCQNVFTAREMNADWPAWEALIDQLSRDANINKRRAALVLLNSPVHYADDVQFRDLALSVIDRLKAERHILITKAVSWLLRSMIARHRAAVELCLAEHGPTLPAIAVRETRTKLATGTKSGRRRAVPDQSQREVEKAAAALTFEDADVARCYAWRPPYAPALYDVLLARTQGRRRALDLGCGPGKIALVLADHFAEVTALDPSAAMIEAGRRADAGRHGNIVWINQRAEDLDADRSFDLVTAGTAIHWMRHDVLFPKLATLTQTMAVISGDETEHPPCGHEAWVEFKTRWLARVGRIYDQTAFQAEGRRYEPWLDIVGQECFAFTFRQSVEDFIASQHARATWARAAMGAALADEFDRDLETLMRPYASDGVLKLDLISNLVWGAPRSSPR